MTRVNRDRLETDIRRFSQANGAGRKPRAKQWVVVLGINVVTYLIAIPLLSGNGLSVYNPSRAALWVWLAATVVVTAGNMALRDWSTRHAALDVDVAARRIERDIEKLEGLGWMARTLRQGVYLGLAIGVSIGLLMVLLLPPAFGAGWERWKGAWLFLGATLAWTIPMSFAIRWLSLRSMKKYVISESQ
jgi:hypothetical protein